MGNKDQLSLHSYVCLLLRPMLLASCFLLFGCSFIDSLLFRLARTLPRATESQLWDDQKHSKNTNRSPEKTEPPTAAEKASKLKGLRGDRRNVQKVPATRRQGPASQQPNLQAVQKSKLAAASYLLSLKTVRTWKRWTTAW